MALYLFLVTVADNEGLSYYSDSTISKMILSLNGHALLAARHELVDAQLIAYQKPLYQVLALDVTTIEPRQALKQPASIGELLKGMGLP